MAMTKKTAISRKVRRDWHRAMSFHVRIKFRQELQELQSRQQRDKRWEWRCWRVCVLEWVLHSKCYCLLYHTATHRYVLAYIFAVNPVTIKSTKTKLLIPGCEEAKKQKKVYMFASARRRGWVKCKRLIPRWDPHLTSPVFVCYSPSFWCFSLLPMYMYMYVPCFHFSLSLSRQFHWAQWDEHEMQWGDLANSIHILFHPSLWPALHTHFRFSLQLEEEGNRNSSVLCFCFCLWALGHLAHNKQ